MEYYPAEIKPNCGFIQFRLGINVAIIEIKLEKIYMRNTISTRTPVPVARQAR